MRGSRAQVMSLEARSRKKPRVTRRVSCSQGLEALIEYGDKLEAHDRLNARQNHASLVGRVGCFLFETLAMLLLGVHRVSRSLHLHRLALGELMAGEGAGLWRR